MDTGRVIIYGLFVILAITAAVGSYTESWIDAAVTFGALMAVAFDVLIIWLFIRMSNDVQRIREWLDWHFGGDEQEEDGE